MRKVLCLLLAIFGLSGAASLAQAGTITNTVDFVATNFDSLFFGGAAPFTTVTGSITFTLDPTQAYGDETSGIAVNHIDVPYSGAAKFDYDPTTKFLVLGAALQANPMQGGIPDFSLAIFLVDPAFQSGSFGYTVAYPDIDIYQTYDVTITFATPIVTTPIPAALPLFAAALGSLGFLGWRRRKFAVAA